MWLKRIKSLCALYGILLYLFDPPKTWAMYISAVLCLLIIVFVDIVSFLEKEHNLNSDDEKKNK